MQLENKNILVLGYAKTGRSVVRFLENKNANIFIYDDKLDKIEKYKLVKNIENLDIDLCVISPGISIYCDIAQQIAKRNIKIISEIELAYRFCKGSIIAVTGTNGKTTTVNLLYEILKTAKREVFLCGNVGIPFIDIVEKTSKHSLVVCEVSSYQLEAIETFKPHISALLNIQPDHITRHKTYENYILQKYKIFQNQAKTDYLVLNNNLPQLCSNSRQLRFSLSDIKSDAYRNRKWLYYRNRKIINTSDITLLGDKNYENVMASIIIAKLCKVKRKYIQKAIKAFKAQPNRLEIIGLKKGVLYVNDSKATNVASTICAVESFKSIVLLLGGSDKGFEFDDALKCKNIKKVIAFGEVKEKILSAAKRQNVEIFVANTLKQATVLASNISMQGDVVLLSPACASFDEFSSYEERGEKFKEYFKEL